MHLTADMSAAVNAVQGAYRESSKSMREDVEACVSLIRGSELFGGRRGLVAVPPPAQLTWRAVRGRMRKRGYSLPRLMILCGPGSQRAQGNEARARKAIQALPMGRSDLCCSFLCTVFFISTVFPAKEELDTSFFSFSSNFQTVSTMGRSMTACITQSAV